MYLLYNLIENRYTIYISLILLLYIINLVFWSILSVFDFILVLYIIFLELFKREKFIYISILTGFMLDLLYMPIIGIYMLLFYTFYIIKLIYFKFFNFDHFNIRFFFYCILIFIYINFNLIYYGFSYEYFMPIVMQRFLIDIFFILLINYTIKRASFDIKIFR